VVGEASVLSVKRQWFRSGSQRLIAGALPIAAALSLGSSLMGALLPSFVLAYLVGAHLLVNLALCVVSLSLLGLRDQRGRWFDLTLACTGLAGVLSSLWLMGETVILGLPVDLSAAFLVIDSLTNVVLIIGLAATSIGQHRRLAPRLAGYLPLSLLFVACVYLTYQADLYGGPPVPFSLALDGRMLLSFLSAVFAWSFVFSQKPSLEVVGRGARGVLVGALVLQLLARTLFAVQYASLHTAVSSFFLVGSPSDAFGLFAQSVLLIAVLAFFTGIVELVPVKRLATIKCSAASRALLLGTLVVAVLVTATTAIALVGRVLPVFLSQADAMLALHTVAAGLLLGGAVVILALGLAAMAMTRLMTRPIEQLDEEITQATQAGLTSYRDPPNLIFAELQGISDGYRQLLDALKRTRAQLRTPDPFARRQPNAPTSASGVDTYSAVLENQASSANDAISKSTEALARMPDDKTEMNRRLKEVIAATEQLQEILRVLQTLRQVEGGEAPEPSSKDLGNVLRQVVEATKERFPHRLIRVSLQLSDPHPRILASDLVTDIFASILRCIVENDPSEEVGIDTAVSQVRELETTYWQTLITSHGWFLSDEQKDGMFQPEAAQGLRTPPGLFLARALVEALHGSLRTGSDLPEDRHYGTTFAVLLPAVMQAQSSASRLRLKKPEPKPSKR
jgi:hypothetical protein